MSHSETQRCELCGREFESRAALEKHVKEIGLVV
jgi:hypothetical protein